MTPGRVLAAGLLWRLFGVRGSGETLVQAFAADDEQNRMLAGISLVKAGHRSFDLIEQKVEQGQASASLIRLLPDIDDQASRPVLERLAGGDDKELAAVANQCIAMIDRIAFVDENPGPGL